MPYVVEFLRWPEGSLESEIVSRVPEAFLSEHQAYVHASTLMDEMKTQGATAFRIFVEGEKPDEISPYTKR